MGKEYKYDHARIWGGEADICEFILIFKEL